METLILNSASQDDVRLLMDIAKKLGMDLRVADLSFFYGSAETDYLLSGAGYWK